MKYLRPMAFSLMGVIIILLMVATICEKLFGTEFAVRYFYTAPWTIILWSAAVISGLGYLFTVKMYRQVIACLLHFSFVVILGGAMTTHIFGQSGQIHLRLDEAPVQVLQSDVQARLLDFHLDYYPGTRAPMDFVSEIELSSNTSTEVGQVYMNHIFSYQGYRFYQSLYDEDGKGTTLSVSYDPWGIGITYGGYGLLLFSILAFFFWKRTHFRQLLKSPLLKSVLIIIGVSSSLTINAAKTLQRPVAKSFGNLYVYYNDRLCPMSTVATDFCTKIYGKPSYQGLTAEQVLTGWLFYYDEWVREPMIKIKGDEVKQSLGADGKYVSLRDFIGNGAYKIDHLLHQGNKNAKAADEKFQLISMACMGTLIEWAPMPFAEPDDELYLARALDQIALRLLEGRNVAANDSLIALRAWQQERLKAFDALPNDTRFRAEQLYNSFHYTRPLAMACATIGLVLFFLCCLMMAKGRTLNKYVHYTLLAMMALLWLFLTFALGLRWFVSGHVPLSNGFETMQFLSWVTALATLFLSRKKVLPLAFGYLICGMTLMVSMMSSANPQITNLMPVLSSPLLTIHVAIIMIAYCLLAFIMLNGVTALILHKRTEVGERLQVLSQVLLYPAVFCLTIGIFIGAVWANISWGRYWGWDPKEVWALITMLLYAAPIHTNSLPMFRKPLVFHTYMALTFLAVLFTYFGVNFILGGLHSYA